jgi:hypothetical protein
MVGLHVAGSDWPRAGAKPEGWALMSLLLPRQKIATRVALSELPTAFEQNSFLQFLEMSSTSEAFSQSIGRLRQKQRSAGIVPVAGRYLGLVFADDVEGVDDAGDVLRRKSGQLLFSLRGCLLWGRWLV